MSEGAAGVDVSVVLPVYRQADQLADILKRARAALRGVAANPEIILVVNDRLQETLRTAEALARLDPAVRVLESQSGWGVAVRAGLEAARGELLCYTNSARTQAGDLQMALRYGHVNEAAVVKASRKQRRQFLRRLGSVIYNFECRMMFGIAVWDVNGTPKVFHRCVLNQLDLTEDGDLIDLEFCVLCKERGIPVVEMPVYDTTRVSGKATTNLRSAVRLYSKPMFMRRQLARRAASWRGDHGRA
jgi:dolichyl-phosphate beta-glucosyltransferase